MFKSKIVIIAFALIGIFIYCTILDWTKGTSVFIEYNEKDLFKNNQESFKNKNIQFKQPTYSDNKINLTNFNYTGKCGNVFKYKQNNKRDLIFTAIKYNTNFTWRKHKPYIIESTNLLKNTIPNAKKVCILYDNNNELKQFVEECGFEVIEVLNEGSKIKKINAAIDRFLQLEKYLSIHKNEFDRVALIDFRDVYFFADGFQTISSDEVVFTEECVHRYGYDTICFDYTQNTNYRWMKKCYGKEVADRYRKERKHINNVGVIMGGIKPFSELLNVFVNEIKRKSDVLTIWGIDNAMLNYLRYSGAFNGINVTFNSYSQRLAFVGGGIGGYNYDEVRKSIINTIDGCSPIIRHKLGGNKKVQFGI